MSNRERQNYAGAAVKYHNGAKLVDLAKEYGITRQGMKNALVRYGVTDFYDGRRKFNSRNVAAMFNNGMSVKDISRKTGHLESTITFYILVNMIKKRSADYERLFRGLGYADEGQPTVPKKHRRRGAFGNKVRCIETGKIFKSEEAASKKCRRAKTAVSHVICNRQKTTAGYHWELVK